MTSDELAWKGIGIGLDLLNNWYEANEADYEDDEDTLLGLPIREIKAALEAAGSLAARKGTSKCL